MDKKRKHTIIYTFHSLEDPLVKGLILQYLFELNKNKSFVFHLITYEQMSFKLDASREKDKKSELLENDIYWYPVDYHNGKWLLLKKAFDFLKTAWLCTKIKWHYRPEYIIGFLPIAAGFSAILAPILRLKLITYCFEPHSEYMIDFGIWNRKSWKYVLLKKYEKEQLEVSKVIIVPTSHTKKLVERINPFAQILVLPISVDTDKNRFDNEKRLELRKTWNINDKKVLLYLGKFGGIYYSVQEVLKFMYSLNRFGGYHAIIISPEASEVKKEIETSKMDASFFTVLNFIPYNDIHYYISAGDFGIIAVPPWPSQKYRTPVKTGLYLSCGIPYLVNKGIAEDDVLAITHGIGIVVKDILTTSSEDLHTAISGLLDQPGIKDRCREIAIQQRSHHKAVSVLQLVLNHN